MRIQNEVVCVCVCVIIIQATSNAWELQLNYRQTRGKHVVRYFTCSSIVLIDVFCGSANGKPKKGPDAWQDVH